MGFGGGVNVLLAFYCAVALVEFGVFVVGTCSLSEGDGEPVCAVFPAAFDEITADEAEGTHLVFGSSEIDVGVFHPTIVAREGPVEIYCFVGGTRLSVYAKTLVVLSDGVVEIYRHSEILVEQIALMLNGIVGLVGDDKVVAISEPRGDRIFAAAAHEN